MNYFAFISYVVMTTFTASPNNLIVCICFTFDKGSLCQSRENPHIQIQIFVKRESLQEHCYELHNLEMASYVSVNVRQLYV